MPHSIIIQASTKFLKGTVQLPASKSESNRLLIIQNLCKEPFEIRNLSEANDTKILRALLDKLSAAKVTDESLILDAEDAGSSLRFITALAALKMSDEVIPADSIVITGTQQMQKRPIGPLVEALKTLGARIEYLNEEKYPPFEIFKSAIGGNFVEIDGSISSQFITALLLIAPCMAGGLKISIHGNISSKPYIDMTLQMMQQFGINCQWDKGVISIPSQQYYNRFLKLATRKPYYEVEADWSAASYWYSMAALSDSAEFRMKGLKSGSLQGDRVVAEIMQSFGVETTFVDEGIEIIKDTEFRQESVFNYDFSQCPDLAQTIIVLCAALGIRGLFEGLHSLRIKETDRIAALEIELEKLGAVIDTTSNSLRIIEPLNLMTDAIPLIDTYNDHRMALAFAPLLMKYKGVIINNPEVVNKSYPDYWKQLKAFFVL